MKQKSRIGVLLLAATLCISSLTACSGDSTSDDESTQSSASSESEVSSEAEASSESEGTETDSTEEISESADVIGRVTVQGESTLDLNVFETGAEETVEDYTLLDISTLIDTGETATITFTDDTLFYNIVDGALVTASRDTLVVNDLMIAVTENESGVQEIIVLESEEEVDGETENYDVVAEIVSIAEDGTLELTLYELNADAVTAQYTIEDYAAVDFTNYVTTAETSQYVAEENVTINVAVDGALTEADASAFAVGDMLVFYLGEEDAQTITIYRSEE